MQYQAYPAQPAQQAYQQQGYAYPQPYQAAPQPMMRPAPQPMATPAAPQARPYPPQPAPPRPALRQPKVRMPADYDPKHPPIGYMPEMPEGGQDEYMNDTVMFDDTSRKQRNTRARDEARARRDRNRATRAEAVTGKAEKPAQRSRSAQPATPVGRTEQQAEPDQSATAQEIVTPFALQELPSPIECLLLTGENASANRVGDHVVRFSSPLVKRGENIEYNQDTRMVELKEDGVYHFAYSGRVSAANRRGLRSLSGLGIVQDDDEAMHAIPADHGAGALSRASFIGECKKGRRVRLQWHVESADTTLTLSEPLLFIERLK